MRYVGGFRRKFSILLVSAVLLSAHSAVKAVSSTLSGSGDDLSLAVADSTTELRVWGRNYYGQFGTGQTSTTDQLVPLPITLQDISEIESVVDFTGFVKTDGTVLVSGYNNYGEAGQGYLSISIPTPLPVPGLANVAQLSGGADDFFVARLANGTVRSWGRNTAGQLGTGFLSTNSCQCESTVQTVVNLTNVASVSAGTAHVLALRTDGTVWAWGANDYGQLGNGTAALGSDIPVPAQVVGLTNVIAIAAGEIHSLALRSDGTVWVWGANGDGQAGIGTYGGLVPPITIPVQVPLSSGVTAITAGEFHSMALKADGSVWAWGYNLYGETGTGLTSSILPTPTQALISNVASLKTKGDSIIARKTDGTVWTWGRNNHGQLGIGTASLGSNPIPLQVPIPPNIGGLIDIGFSTAFADAPPINNTAVGSNISVQSTAGDAGVTFSQVTADGNTTFTTIDASTAGTVPSGYTLCPLCQAYDITTTATYTPPVTVCLFVPSTVDDATFNALSLLHGENGVLVDVTTSHIANPDGTREVCGQVDSLSPFVLAQMATVTPTPPAAPNDLKATAVSSTQINLTWQDNSDNEDHFELERCDGKGRCRTFMLIASPGENVVSYSDTALDPSSPYAYRIRAVNVVGNSGYSNIAKERTPRR